MRFCSQCGAQRRETARFCASCGAAIKPSSPPPMPGAPPSPSPTLAPAPAVESAELLHPQMSRVERSSRRKAPTAIIWLYVVAVGLPLLNAIIGSILIVYLSNASGEGPPVSVPFMVVSGISALVPGIPVYFVSRDSWIARRILGYWAAMIVLLASLTLLGSLLNSLAASPVASTVANPFVAGSQTERGVIQGVEGIVFGVVLLWILNTKTIKARVNDFRAMPFFGRRQARAEVNT